ncbi:MAG: tyrosine--tRNA ligase, partial [Mucilaginibacter sp.]
FNKKTIEALEAEHATAPHLRALQKALAMDITIRTHGDDEYQKAIKSSEFLFGNTAIEFLHQLNENEILSLFEGVPNFRISLNELNDGINIIELLAVKTSVFSSKNEAKRMIDGGGVLVQRMKIESGNVEMNRLALVNDKFLVVQKGKKNYFLIIAE